MTKRPSEPESSQSEIENKRCKKDEDLTEKQFTVRFEDFKNDVAKALQRKTEVDFEKFKKKFQEFLQWQLEEEEEGHLACICLAFILNLNKCENDRNLKKYGKFFKDHFKTLYHTNKFSMKKITEYATNLYESFPDSDTDILLNKFGVRFIMPKDSDEDDE